MTLIQAAGATFAMILISTASHSEGISAGKPVAQPTMAKDVGTASTEGSMTRADKPVMPISTGQDLNPQVPDFGLLPVYLNVFQPIAADDWHSGE